MRFWQLGIRALKETYRDPMALGFLLGFPLMFMLLFGFAFSGEGSASYQIGVIDEDQTPVSIAFADEALPDVPAYEISYINTPDEALTKLKQSDIRAYVIIPAGFGEEVNKLWAGENGNIYLDVTYDESDIQAAGEILSQLNAVCRAFAKIEIPLSINAQPVNIENKITNIDFISPGIIVFGLLILIPTSARIMVRDKEKGFMSRMLTTPSRPVDFILGYSLSMTFICIIQIIFFMLLGYLFGMDITGNIALAFLIFFLTGLSSIGIGMVIAGFSKSENQSESISWFFSMPLAMVSGTWFSIQFMPDILKGLGYAFPYSHAIEASRLVILRGADFSAVSSEIGILAVWTVAIFALGTIIFGRTMRS
ncbi:MAG: hypothetical protein AMXMBFR85_03060 [Dehalococcoides mccartyi]